MTTPIHNPDIHIHHPKALQYEISWREYAVTMEGIESEVKSLLVPNSILLPLVTQLALPITQGTGIFLHEAVAAYNEACHHFQSWCSQGNTEMDNVAKALKESFRLYSRTEEEIVQSIITLAEALN